MLLKLEEIKKYYRIAGQKKEILKGVSLELGTGGIISITGPSGCGKTTLLNIISGITSPSAGKVYVNGKKLVYLFDIVPSAVRNREIGFIFQTFNLIHGETVMSNVLLPARIKGRVSRETGDYAKEILGRLKIYKYRTTRAGLLSGGQKQRVAIARALINRPSIILADEPTANLDKKTSIEIFDILADLKDEGKSVIIITHTDYMHPWLT